MGVDVRGVAYLGAVVVTGLIAWQITKAAKAAAGGAGAVVGAVGDRVAAAAQAVNPLNPENVFAGTVNRTVQNLTGDSTSTLGTKLAEWFDPATRAADRAVEALRAPGGGLLTQSQGNVLSQLAIDQEDADLGAVRRANQLGLPFISAADIEDMEMGAAIRGGGAQVSRMAVTPGFSYITRTGKNF